MSAEGLDMDAIRARADAAQDGREPSHFSSAEVLTLLDHVRALEQENAGLRDEHRAFTARLGFGDGVTEPAAPLAAMVDSIEQAVSEAAEWREGPRICEPCGEWLADTICEPCHGSGCGPGTASGAYSECEWCAGVGKVHPGCVEESYADLAAERDAARAALDGLRAAITVVIGPEGDEWRWSDSNLRGRLRAVLGEHGSAEGLLTAPEGDSGGLRGVVADGGEG